VLENRLLSKRLIPRAFEAGRVRQVNHYSARLAAALRSVSPIDPDRSTVVVLTPGPYNSAYFEHSFLARQMGVELVQAADLFVDEDKLFLHTTRGPRQVHVVYRRTDDAFLDPEMFRPDSLLGVRGLVRAWAKGNVALANAPGNGVADDKAVYPFVPEMVRFYLGEEPLLEQVPTYQCTRESDRRFVLEHLAELVVKAVDEAGGYGMLWARPPPRRSGGFGGESSPSQRVRRPAAHRAFHLSDVDPQRRRRSAPGGSPPLHPDRQDGPFCPGPDPVAAGRSCGEQQPGRRSKDTWVEKANV
jgi:uncharacterized circularly permuted ATP-grasp superfamily protein